MARTQIVLLVACAASGMACSGTPEAEADVAGVAVVDSALHALPPRAARGLEISPVPVDTRAMSLPERIAVGLGSYIVNAAADCGGCHSSPAGFLAGGTPFPLDPGGAHIVFSRNLTPDSSTGMHLTRKQFFEAIRTGHDFRPGARVMLVVMPWQWLRWQGDADLAAIYAYLRAIPPVTNAVPPDVKDDLPLPPSIPFPHFYDDGQVDRFLPDDAFDLYAARGFAISPLATPRLRHVSPWEFGRGSYLVNAQGICGECHTNPSRVEPKLDWPLFLTGGQVFVVPPPISAATHQLRSMSADLRGATHGFLHEPGDSFHRFRAIIETGTHVDEPGHPPLGWPMSEVASALRNLVDEDLEAMYRYEKTLPPVTGDGDKATQPYARDCGACLPTETCEQGECVARSCESDADCAACQTCSDRACHAPTDAGCINGGI